MTTLISCSRIPNSPFTHYLPRVNLLIHNQSWIRPLDERNHRSILIELRESERAVLYDSAFPYSRLKVWFADPREKNVELTWRVLRFLFLMVARMHDLIITPTNHASGHTRTVIAEQNLHSESWSWCRHTINISAVSEPICRKGQARESHRIAVARDEYTYLVLVSAMQKTICNIFNYTLRLLRLLQKVYLDEQTC